MFDYCKLRGKIREVFGTETAFAKAMRMSSVSLSKKLNGLVDFTTKEIDLATDLLGIPKDEISIYFFTIKVQNS